MTFSKLGESLLDGKIDLIANNYWPTPDRERLYAFTVPYFVRGGVGSLWIEGTGTFDTAASMAAKRVAVMKGSYPEAWAREHVPTRSEERRVGKESRPRAAAGAQIRGEGSLSARCV